MLRLLGVEFLVIAEAWHAANALPLVLMGQQFHYVGSPNRDSLPAFYELHVWAWNENPHGISLTGIPTSRAKRTVTGCIDQHRNVQRLRRQPLAIELLGVKRRGISHGSGSAHV